MKLTSKLMKKKFKESKKNKRNKKSNNNASKSRRDKNLKRTRRNISNLIGGGNCSDDLQDYPENLNLNITIKTNDGKDITYDVISGKQSDINNCSLYRDELVVIDDIKNSYLYRDELVVIDDKRDNYDEIMNKHFWENYKEVFIIVPKGTKEEDKKHVIEEARRIIDNDLKTEDASPEASAVALNAQRIIDAPDFDNKLKEAGQLWGEARYMAEAVALVDEEKKNAEKTVAEKAKYIEDKIRDRMKREMNRWHGQFHFQENFVDHFNYKTSGGGSVNKFDPEKVQFPEYFKDQKFVQDFVKEVKDIYTKDNGINCLNKRIQQFINDREALDKEIKDLNKRKASTEKAYKVLKGEMEQINQENKVEKIKELNEQLKKKHKDLYFSSSKKQKVMMGLLEQINEHTAVRPSSDFNGRSLRQDWWDLNTGKRVSKYFITKYKVDDLKPEEFEQKFVEEEGGDVRGERITDVIASFTKQKEEGKELEEQYKLQINDLNSDLTKNEELWEKMERDTPAKKQALMDRYKILRKNINVSVRAVYWYLFRKYIDVNRLVTFPYGWTYNGGWERFHKNCYNLFYNLIYNTPEIPGSCGNPEQGGDFGMSEFSFSNGNGIKYQIWAPGFDCLDADHKRVLDIVKDNSQEWKNGLAEFWTNTGEQIQKSWKYDKYKNSDHSYKIMKDESTPPETLPIDDANTEHSKETCNTQPDKPVPAAVAGGKRKNKSKRRTRKGKI